MVGGKGVMVAVGDPAAPVKVGIGEGCFSEVESGQRSNASAIKPIMPTPTMIARLRVGFLSNSSNCGGQRRFKYFPSQ